MQVQHGSLYLRVLAFLVWCALAFVMLVGLSVMAIAVLAFQGTQYQVVLSVGALGYTVVMSVVLGVVLSWV
jgi:hypothetical protein